MRITHFGHACVLVETESTRLLVDPGSFSTGFEHARELDAILFTHQHFDHLDLERLPALLAANPGVRVLADPGSAEQLTAQDIAAERTVPGDVHEVNGTAVSVVGGEHAVIHPDLPTIPNVGYLFEHGAFYHPGDSYHVPEQRVDVLGMPTGAPWLKVSEAVEFLRAVEPRVAVPIHEAVLARPQMHYRFFEQLAPAGTTLTVLDQGEPTAV